METSKQNTTEQLTELANRIKQVRYDYFLIWGHGLKHSAEIIQEIRGVESLEIVEILAHTPASVEELVNEVYSHDYAPIEHLRGKLAYLLDKKIPNDVLFIFIKNNDADEVYLGEGEFNHIESAHIKRLKEQIRDKFNPRSEGKRSEHHVIHASDNELQTDYILKYLGRSAGVELFKKEPNPILNAPYHLGTITEFSLRLVNLDDMVCKIVSSENPLKYKTVPIAQTPHFKALKGENSLYYKYLHKFAGKLLRDNHYLEKLSKLNEKMAYLDDSHSRDYIICRLGEDGKYYIQDGVHRASILKFRQQQNAIVAVIE